MKCPNCGHEPPEPPYEYTGYLKPYLPQMLKLLRMGLSPGDVAMTLRQLHRAHFSVAMISYIRKRYGIKSKNGPTSDKHVRNLEIARRYASETISMRRLGSEYDISGDRVRCIISNVRRKQAELERQQQACRIAESVKDVPLESLELPVRVLNCFKNGRYENGRWIHQCETVGDAMKLSDAELLRIPNFGLTSLNDWKFHLGQLMREFKEREQTAEAQS